MKKQKSGIKKLKNKLAACITDKHIAKASNKLLKHKYKKNKEEFLI